MAERIPDLWRAKEDAARLYQLYLLRLRTNSRLERVVTACRQIRRYAACGPGSEEGLFTFSFEIDALCELQQYHAAWRQLRLREQIVFGERLDPIHRQWSASDGWELAYYYAPLLFFLGRYRQGCALLETFLGFWFRGGKVRSYDMLFHVYNGDEQPSNRCRVTLSHFYDRLGNDLDDWQYWEAFVSGFHPRLFRLAGVRRDELVGDAGLLALFYDKLIGIRSKRTTSRVSSGERDLIDSASKVRKRQEATQRKLNSFRERVKATRERTDAKLGKLFPDLKGLSM